VNANRRTAVLAKHTLSAEQQRAVHEVTGQRDLKSLAGVTDRTMTWSYRRGHSFLIRMHFSDRVDPLHCAISWFSVFLTAGEAGVPSA
jgi:hypothetical protein